MVQKNVPKLRIMFCYFVLLLVVEANTQRPPSRNFPLSYVNGPLSYVHGPLSYVHGPLSYVHGPLSYDQGPLSYDQGPLSYVQARNAFARARLYLQERLPDKTGDVTDPKARIHFNFGILAGVTLALVEAFYSTSSEYDPLKVLQEAVPVTWEDYNEVSRNVKNLLAKANARIRPIETLIDTLCTTTESVQACNLVVHEHVIHDVDIAHRAKFLLQLGKPSRYINKKAKLLDNVAASNNAVPYLYKTVDTAPFEVFIAQLTEIHEILLPKQLNRRRSQFETSTKKSKKSSRFPRYRLD